MSELSWIDISLCRPQEEEYTYCKILRAVAGAYLPWHATCPQS